MKDALKRRGAPADRPLAGKTLAMIFDKPSTRTRVSFDVAMRQLGGDAIMLTGQEMQLGRGETIADTARVLSRYVDAIMIRTLDHATLIELARHATVPVINGLTRRSHPCQVMADVMTFEEHRGPIQRPHRGLDRRRQQRAGLLDACRGSASISACKVATPPELAPKKRLLDWAKASGAAIRDRHTTRGGGGGRRLRRRPTPGSRWATRTASAATTCSSPTRSTRG